MKKIVVFSSLVSGISFFMPAKILAQVSSCPNLDFSYGTAQHWQCYVGSSSGGNYHVQRSPAVPGRHTIMDFEALIAADELYDEQCQKIQKVPKGYRFSARIGNSDTGAEVDAMEYEMRVDSMNSLLILSFAWVMENGGHAPSEQPQFTMKIVDSNGIVLPIPCGNINYIPQDGMEHLKCETNSLVARDWTTVGFSLEAVIGQRIKIYFETWDCTLGCHFGYAYVVGECCPMRIDLAYCSGTNVARLRAPDGFESYIWTRSDQPGWTDNQQQVTIQNPEISSVVTCVVRSELGCESQLSTMILKTEIDARFHFGVKDQGGGFPIFDWQNWYDTCSRTATFVDFARVYNSKKQSILWEIHGLNVNSRDSMFTYTFPDPDEPTEYLVRLTVTAENGCMDTSQSTGNYITIFPSPKIKIEGTDQLCEGKEAWLKPIALRYEFSTHHWSWVKKNGETGNFVGDSLHIDGPGIYYLKSLAINATDCYAYDTLIVTPLKPEIHNLMIKHVDCSGNATGSFRYGTISGGKPPFQVAYWTVWDNDNKVFIDSNILDRIGEATFWGQIAGAYTFYGIDADGCEMVDTIIIQEPDSLHIFATTEKATCLENDGKLTLEAIGGWSGYVYRIEKEDGTPVPLYTSNSASNLNTGIYTITVTDTMGCATSDTISITAEEAIVEGKVLQNGVPLRGVTITIMYLDDSTYVNTTTNALGEYSIIVSCNSSIIIIPDLPGYSFTPPSITLSNVIKNIVNQNFKAKTPVSISDKTTNNSSITIYPNPAYTELYIKHSSQETANYVIYNVIGQIILQGKLLNDFSSINIESLAKGMYFLRISDKMVKFVKQ